MKVLTGTQKISRYGISGEIMQSSEANTGGVLLKKVFLEIS